MDFLMNPLNLMTFFPLVGVAIILLIPRERKDAIRWTAVITSLVSFFVSLQMLMAFHAQNPGFQMVYDKIWMKAGGFEIHYALGVDGLSILLVLLTTLLTPLSIFSAWTAIEDRVKEFAIAFLVMEVGMLGVFLALDLFTFFVFWEFSLVPMYFIIGIWGGPRRTYSAIKFMLYTMVGSVLMLLAILWLGLSQGTFYLPDLLAKGVNLPLHLQSWLFLAFALAFAIKVPMWPLHSWLPDAHVEAPTAGSVILAGVLLKMGTYGFLRFNLSLFPEASVKFAVPIAVLAIVGIIYGAMVAYAQKDFKKLVAYTSVSHLGFVMLGLFALNARGIAGGILQMINHGISTGALFLIVGVIYERLHTRDLSAFGGLWKIMPIYGAFSIIVALSSMGLPGMNGFIGEFTILMGAFESPVLGPAFAISAALGIVLAAVYILVMLQKVFLGPVKEENKGLKDLNWREITVLAVLTVFIFWIGLHPAPFFNLMMPAVEKLAGGLQAAVLAMH